MITGSHKLAKWYHQEGKVQNLPWGRKKKGNLNSFAFDKGKTWCWLWKLEKLLKASLHRSVAKGFFPYSESRAFCRRFNSCFVLFSYIFHLQAIHHLYKCKYNLKKKTWKHLCCLNEEMFLLFVRLIPRSQTFLVGKTSESNGTRSWNCTNRTKCLTMLFFLPPCNVPC